VSIKRLFYSLLMASVLLARTFCSGSFASDLSCEFEHILDYEGTFYGYGWDNGRRKFKFPNKSQENNEKRFLFYLGPDNNMPCLLDFKNPSAQSLDMFQLKINPLLRDVFCLGLLHKDRPRGAIGASEVGGADGAKLVFRFRLVKSGRLGAEIAIGGFGKKDPSNINDGKKSALNLRPNSYSLGLHFKF